MNSVSGKKTDKKVFYGWWIVMSTAIVSLYSGGTWFYGFTVFVDPIVAEFGWSYFAVSLAASFRGIEVGIAAPLMGILVDKLGPRKLIFIGGLVAGASFFFLSSVNSLPMFYLAFILVSFGFSTCEAVVLFTAVANWFSKKAGLAIGIASLGFGFSGLVLPLMSSLVATYDWRTTFIIIGVGSATLIPLLSLVFRHKPEQYGYRPDGYRQPVPEELATDEQSSPRVENSKQTADAGMKQAAKSRSLWFLSLAMSLMIAGAAAVLLHIVPFISTTGLDAATAAWIAGFISISSIAGRLVFGWLGDIIGRKRVLALNFACIAVGLILLTFGQSTLLLIVFVVLFGTSYGGAMILRPAVQREYFGIRAFGSIQGLTMLIGTAGAVGGPMLAGWIFDTRGSYDLAWIIFAIATVVAIPLVLMVTPVLNKTNDLRSKP